ncbi:MAG: DUF4148 domain-containing protein [Candidatus Protistobacter heckmanni]|nr:DUF4148 domain-containing protein [Candidatus Protistobacter heckmanni]
MKAKHWMAAVASVAGLAGATEIYGWQTDVDKFKDFKSTKTRAKVIAELEKARASGELDHYRNNYEYQQRLFQDANSSKTREEVRAEEADRLLIRQEEVFMRRI